MKKFDEYIIPINDTAKDYDEMFVGVIRRQPVLTRCKDGRGMKPKPFEIIVEFIPQCTKTGITYETYQKGLLIRCKDCKYYFEKEWIVGAGSYTTCWYQIIANAQPNDFCSRAERRDA